MNPLKTTQLFAQLINKRASGDTILKIIRARGGDIYLSEIDEVLDGLTQNVEAIEVDWIKMNDRALYTSDPYSVLINGVPIIKVAQLLTL